MGLLGTSAQAFTDNFLKTYMAIGEDRRAEASQKIAQQMAQAKLEEIARENAMRDEAAKYQQGLMAPVQGELQAPIPQTQPKLGLLGGQSIQLGDPELLNQPTRQTYNNQYDAWKAEGKDPQRESLLGLSNVISKYDPIKSAEIRSKIFNNDERVQAQLEIANIRSQTQMDAIKEKFTQAIELLKQKNDYDSALKAKDLEVKWARLEKAWNNKSQESDPYKQQTSDARAQQMAMRDLKAEGYTMDMVGNWTLDGQPVKSSIVLPKYQRLVQQYKVGNVRESEPSSSVSSYISGVLKK